MCICYSPSWHASYSSFMAWIHCTSYRCLPHSFSPHYLCIVKEEFELERELDWRRLWERDLECKSRTWLAEVDSVLQCFNVDSVEGKVDSVGSSATTTSDLHVTTCSNLGELTHSLDLSLYCVSLLNNWFLIEEESGWVFPLWALPWSLDLNSLCLISFVIVFYCAFDLCVIYNCLSNITT